MRTHRFASHSPEEQRRLSNLGHIVEGALFSIVGILALLGALGIVSWASAAWAWLILIAGVLLLLLIYPRHPLSDWLAIWNDMQQRQHTLMAAGIAVAGIAELLRGSGSSLLAYFWPAVMIGIGVLFLIHEQHGTSEAAAQAVRQHRVLGITVISAGLLRVGEIVLGLNALGFIWPLALLGAAAQLLIYREPAGTFESHGGHGRHDS